jgi:RNA polymerase sporulation-specific sigma factor
MALNRVVICGVNTSKLPNLSEQEKNELFDRIDQGDSDARRQFIEGNLRLVLSVIQRFGNAGENPDDLFQVGCIGLIKALDNFDRSLNVKFSTYAVPIIIDRGKGNNFIAL